MGQAQAAADPLATGSTTICSLSARMGEWTYFRIKNEASVRQHKVPQRQPHLRDTQHQHHSAYALKTPSFLWPPCPCVHVSPLNSFSSYSVPLIRCPSKPLCIPSASASICQSLPYLSTFPLAQPLLPTKKQGTKCQIPVYTSRNPKLLNPPHSPLTIPQAVHG